MVVNGAARYGASYSASTTITDDEDAEHSETFIVAISKRDSPRNLTSYTLHFDRDDCAKRPFSGCLFELSDSQ